MLITPIKRTQDRVTFDDGSKVLRCYGPHNPHAFSRNDIKFFPINLSGIKDTLSSIGGVYLRDQNVRSVAFRKDLVSEKLFGIRPDNAQGGKIQFEVTPLGLKLNAIEGSLSASKIDVKNGIMTDCGPFKVSHTRQGARIFLPFDGGYDSFRMSFRVDTVGLDCIYRDDLDEYWFHRKDGKGLFCRLRKPDIFDLLGANPVWGELDIDPMDLIGHDLVENADGSFIYTKFSKDLLSKVGIPAFLVDGDVYYGDTADGYVHNTVSDDWDATRSATTGTGLNSSYERYSGAIYVSQVPYIRRSFFMFDTSGVGTVNSALLNLYGYSANSGDVMAMLGIQADTLTTADYDSFSGTSYGSFSSWNITGYNELNIDTDDVVDGNTKVCVRNKTYDYDDGGIPDTGYLCGVYFSDYTGTTRDPYLEITEVTGWPHKVAGVASPQGKIGGVDFANVGKVAGVE